MLLLVVLWVWANAEATANPKMAMMARSEINVFIIDTGFKQESLPTIAADVETDRATAKVISLKSYVERQTPLTSKFVQLRDLPVGAPWRQYIRPRRS